MSSACRVACSAGSDGETALSTKAPPRVARAAARRERRNEFLSRGVCTREVGRVAARDASAGRGDTVAAPIARSALPPPPTRSLSPPKALSPQARQASSQKARQAHSRAVVQTPQKK